MSYVKIKLPDSDILNRITEAEVFEWLAAKAVQIESKGLPVSSVEIECWKRERFGIERETYYDVCCSVHAKSKLSLKLRLIFFRRWKQYVREGKIPTSPECRTL